MYQTGRSGKAFTHTIAVPPGLCTVHVDFAELWLEDVGDRPTLIEINGRVVRDGWDPASAARQVGMVADLRVKDIAPDCHGVITVGIHATGPNNAILQGLEIE